MLKSFLRYVGLWAPLSVNDALGPLKDIQTDLQIVAERERASATFETNLAAAHTRRAEAALTEAAHADDVLTRFHSVFSLTHEGNE